MARRRTMRSSGRRGGSQRTAWSLAPQNEITGTFTAATTAFDIELYDFGGATKMADNYGAGDWVIQRLLGSFAVNTAVAGASPGLIKVCFGIGIVNPVGGISDASAAQAARLLTNPELSWMVFVCCYINIEDLLRVERCDFDVRGKRKIGPQSKLVATVETVTLTGAEEVNFIGNARFLMAQKGSRV